MTITISELEGGGEENKSWGGGEEGRKGEEKEGRREEGQ